MKTKILNRNFIFLIIGQASSTFGTVFLSPFGGILADRANKRNLLVFSLSFLNVLIPITMIMVGLSVVSSFEMPVVQSSIPLIQQKDTLVQSNAIVSQINMLANLIAPLLAGIFYGTIGKNYLQGVQIIFLCCAACFLLAAILEVFIKIPTITGFYGNCRTNRGHNSRVLLI